MNVLDVVYYCKHLEHLEDCGIGFHLLTHVYLLCHCWMWAWRVCVLMSSSRRVLISTSSDNTSIRRLRRVTPSDAAMFSVRIWLRETIWTEESGSSVRVVHRDMNSLDFVNKDFRSVSHPTTTTFCLELQGPITGKVFNDVLCLSIYCPLKQIKMNPWKILEA